MELVTSAVDISWKESVSLMRWGTWLMIATIGAE
jgi:hypothetical protein